MQNQQNNTDTTLLACRVLDVQSALQSAFSEFSQQDDNSLDNLALTIQKHLGNIPAFLLETTDPQD